ncbi:hypothetical protein Fmac_017560 [Flemingia macrophylla]|uniref:Transposase-associated domain-containing protein n=1 Tax=Flemingia macrophylla TaxID=520843 RepID=A0ABD1M2I2_9FABA
MDRRNWFVDRTWMDMPRTSDEYEAGVESFIEYVLMYAEADANGKYCCPCVKCINVCRVYLDEITEHLICDGMIRTYRQWVWHGEKVDINILPSTSQTSVRTEDIDMDDRLEDMIRDVGPENFKKAYIYDSLCSDSEKPLYPNCENFSRLSATLRLFNLKARNGWTDKSFTELLQLLKEMLPEKNCLPSRHYEAKKILCPMGLEYNKIHACPNDCILYRGVFEGLHQCPRCGVSRYKKKDCAGESDVPTKGQPSKVLWYLPIIPRLKRLTLAFSL